MRADLLGRALYLADSFGLRDEVRELAGQFVELVAGQPADERCGLVNAAAGPCLESLRRLGLSDEIERVVGRLRDLLPTGRTPAEGGSPAGSRGRPGHLRAATLQSLLHLACGWLILGRAEVAAPILAEAREELVRPDRSPLPAHVYTALAKEYVSALGHGPADTGLPRIVELFRGWTRVR